MANYITAGEWVLAGTAIKGISLSSDTHNSLEPSIYFKDYNAGIWGASQSYSYKFNGINWTATTVSKPAIVWEPGVNCVF